MGDVINHFSNRRSRSSRIQTKCLVRLSWILFFFTLIEALSVRVTVDTAPLKTGQSAIDVVSIEWIEGENGLWKWTFGENKSKLLWNDEYRWCSQIIVWGDAPLLSKLLILGLSLREITVGSMNRWTKSWDFCEIKYKAPILTPNKNTNHFSSSNCHCNRSCGQAQKRLHNNVRGIVLYLPFLLEIGWMVQFKFSYIKLYDAITVNVESHTSQSDVFQSHWHISCLVLLFFIC